MSIQGKQVAKYLMTPQIAPRARSLFGSGFSYISYNMALVYRAVGLLPKNHPYLMSENVGRFGISHVITEASRNLRFEWKYADRIVVFFALMLGAILLFLQLIAAGAAFFVSTAKATMPTTWDGFFTTTPPDNDIAFVLLERVFGVPAAGGGGFFNTCVAQGTQCFSSVTGDPTTIAESVILSGGTFPSAFHEALRGVMQFYSVGLLVVGVMIFTYFIFAVVAETAQTGTPFGRRFNRVWAPLRMVVAFGLLIPVANGLNSGQYITLHLAKWGSSFATNGWKLVNDSLTSNSSTLLGDTDRLVAYAETPPLNAIMEFYSAVLTCAIAHNERRENNTDPKIEAWLIRDPASAPTRMQWDTTWPPNYQNALEFYKYGDIIIRFGEYYTKAGEPAYPNEAGFVKPTCGEIIFTTTDIGGAGGLGESPGSYVVQEQYYWFTHLMWYNFKNNCGNPAAFGASYWDSICKIAWSKVLKHITDVKRSYPTVPDPMPDMTEMKATLDGLRTAFQSAANTGITTQRTAPGWWTNYNELGWAGAGIWYNRVAWLNGSLFAAIYNLPYPNKYPAVMEEVKKSKEQNDQNFDFLKRFEPYQSDGQTVDPNLTTSDEDAIALYAAQSSWHGIYDEPEANAVKDVIHIIFGTKGLYNLVDNDANNIHPLAQLVGVGKSLLDSAIRNFGFAGAAFIGGGIASVLGQHGAGGLAIAAANMASSVAMMGLGIGFVLYYIIPFMPFIYFFFAVGGWIKGIFEAMVGVPLWALAHIRIDGEGLPGDAAMNGYYLLLEIFLRPILIVFGLIAALQIFAAQVYVLHDIWDIVLTNITGFNDDAAVANPGLLEFLRSEVDAFFYTIIYAIIVYMLGMAAFKLIDLIPNHILRWMGASVSTFGEQAGDPAENLVRNTMFGTQHIGGSMAQVAQGAGTVATQGSAALQNAVSGAAKRGP